MRSVVPMRLAKTGYIVLSALFCVLADGLFKIQIAIDSRRFGIRSWLLILIVAMFTSAAGAVMVFLPDAGTRLLTALLGLSLLLDGALNLCVAVCTVKIVPHQKPDATEAIDVEYREIGKD